MLDAIDTAFVARLEAGDALPSPTGDSLVNRLLAAAGPDLAALARCVEQAWLGGRRVIAVAGSRPGEGRTTLVACLEAALRARGREVVRTDTCGLPSITADSVAGRRRDLRIVLVDAGVWFPAGPIHRRWLTVATLGIDAAILVRRADTPGGSGRRGCLESLGVEVLGEVLTFTPPPAAAGPAGAAGR